MTPEYERRRSDRRFPVADDEITKSVPMPDGRDPIGKVADTLVTKFLSGTLAIAVGLLGWLCIQTISLKQDTTAILEQNKARDKRVDELEATMKVLGANDRYQNMVTEQIKLDMAQHGWRPNK